MRNDSLFFIYCRVKWDSVAVYLINFVQGSFEKFPAFSFSLLLTFFLNVLILSLKWTTKKKKKKKQKKRKPWIFQITLVLRTSNLMFSCANNFFFFFSCFPFLFLLNEITEWLQWYMYIINEWYLERNSALYPNDHNFYVLLWKSLTQHLNHTMKF